MAGRSSGLALVDSRKKQEKQSEQEDMRDDARGKETGVGEEERSEEGDMTARQDDSAGGVGGSGFRRV